MKNEDPAETEYAFFVADYEFYYCGHSCGQHNELTKCSVGSLNIYTGYSADKLTRLFTTFYLPSPFTASAKSLRSSILNEVRTLSFGSIR